VSSLKLEKIAILNYITIMKKRKKLSNIYMQAFIVANVLIFTAIFFAWLYFDIFSIYKSNMKIIKENILKEKKSLLISVVNNTISYIDYKSESIEKNLKNNIKDETLKAVKIAETIYNNNRNHISRDRIKEIIRDTIRSIRYNNGSGYFFAFDVNGIEQVFADKPELEGKNLLNVKDAKGKYVLKDMIKIATEKGEGFYTYYWTKPNVKSRGLVFKKIAYIKFFKPLKWVVGTGLYYDDMKDKIINEIKDYINKYRFGESRNGYVFIIKVLRKKGKITTIRFLNPNKDNSTLNKVIPLDLKDIKGKMFHKEIVEKSLKQGKGFVTYHFKKLNSEFISEKLTYFKYYPKMQWIIGAGVYIDDIQKLILHNREILLQKLLTKLIVSFLILLIALFIIYKIFKNFNKKVKNEFSNILNKFKEEIFVNKIDTSGITIDEVYETANMLNTLIEHINEQNNILKAYYNKPNIANFIINEKGYFQSVNKAFEEITGYTNEEAKKLVFHSFVHPDYKETVIERGLKRLRGDALPSYYECKIISKKNQVKWILLLNTHIHLKTIDQNIILGTALDITEEKNLLKELNEQYNLFKTLIESLNIPIWVFDTKHNTFKIVNKKFYEYYEVNENIIGCKPDKIFPKEISEKGCETNKEVLKSKTSITYENILKLKKGTRHTIVSKSPVIDEEGNIIGIVGTSFDITEKLKMEKEISKIKNLEALGILAGGIAHDFNNILTSILGNISLMELYVKESKPLEIVERLKNAVKRAENLSKKLMTFSKGRFLTKETGDIVELIKNTAEFIFTGTAVEIEYQIEDNIPEIVMDKYQISEVIHNIVLNARQAMENKENPRLLIVVEKKSVQSGELPELEQGEYVKISIRDNGSGIHEKIIDKIFDPYFTTKEEGSGIGLATSYSIVKQHKGIILVSSEYGVGSLFEIYLPMIEADNNDKSKLESNVMVKNMGKNNLSILVLEDESEIRALIREICEVLGYCVDFAKKGEEVLEIFQPEKYDILIFDMTIKGGMGGVETMEKIRRKYPDIYAVVTTGYVNADIVTNYKEYGFKNTLIKPFNIEKFKKIIRDFSERNKKT
jgi:PAS domain S-box-containing protein